MERGLVAGVIAGAGLNEEIFLVHGELDFVEGGVGIGVVGFVGEGILIAEAVFDFGVDLLDGKLFGDLEKFAAGFFG